VFLVIGVGSLQFVLEDGDTDDWFESRKILVFTILAAVGVLAFIYREIKIDNPAMEISLFKIPNLALPVEGFKGYNLAQGSAISNMARQLGGAFGLALINIRISHSSALFRNSLISNVNDIDKIPVESIQNMTQMISANGYISSDARVMALKIMTE